MKKKTILYITPLYTGAKKFFIEGENEFYGMPAFYNVLLKLIKTESVGQVIMIIFNREGRQKLTVPKNLNHKIKVYTIPYNNNFSLIWAGIKGIMLGSYLALKNKIDKVFGHGEFSAIASLISKLTRTPAVNRIYGGTDIIDEISRNKISIFLKHPLIYLSFSLKAESLIITNDGSKGNEVFKRLGNKESKLHFWINGVDIENVPSQGMQKEPYMTYIARIAKWKQQHLAIEAYHLASQRCSKLPNLYIIGPTFSRDEDYESELKKLISKYNLGKKVKLVGQMSHKDLLVALKVSKITFSLYEVSNLGNVTLESIALGVPLVARNINGSLDAIPDNAYYKINSYKPCEIATAIETLHLNQNIQTELTKNARSFARDQLDTWEKRVDREIKQIIKV